MRYLTSQSNKTLASTAIEVAPAQGSLDAPATAKAGSPIEVAWQGPDNKDGYITVVEAGAGDSQHGNFTYTNEGSPLSLRVPDRAGDYELRYLSGQSNRALASRAITVEAVEASLDAPAQVDAGKAFAVDWQGPDHEGDYITIGPKDAPAKQNGAYAYTTDGNPASLKAPESAGQYQLRYRTGQSGRILARRPITLQ